LARRQIGGQTGDVAGAAQQAAEIAVLLVFSAGGVV
jgi:cobalamin synthase